MYNVRKKLWILAALLFTSSVVLHIVLPDKDDGAISASAGDADTGQQYEYNSSEPIFGEDRERFVAHRGYSGYAPENSIAAFELAGKMGFWGIETDISETSDGAFVCMHDEEIDRTTDGDGSVSDYTLGTLEQFVIDKGNYVRTTENLKIPTFEEYLKICSDYGCVAIIEIKDIRNFDSFLNLIYSSGMQDRCIITSGEMQDLREVRNRNESIPVMTIGYYPSPYSANLTQIAEIAENRGVLYNYPQVDGAHVVEALHGQNVLCAVWSVDDAELAQTYLDYGVDFIVTNEIPARLTYDMINENE